VNDAGKTLARAAPPAWLGWGLSALAAAGVWLLLQRGSAMADAARVTCLFRDLTHVGCPTCGFTRAFVELARGRIGASLVFHPLALPVAGECVAAWVLWGAALLRGAPILRQRWIPAIVLANAAAFAVVWLARFVTGTLPA